MCGTDRSPSFCAREVEPPTASLAYQARVYRGCPAGTHPCDTPSRVMVRQSANSVRVAFRLVRVVSRRCSLVEKLCSTSAVSPVAPLGRATGCGEADLKRQHLVLHAPLGLNLLLAATQTLTSLRQLLRRFCCAGHVCVARCGTAFEDRLAFLGDTPRLLLHWRVSTITDGASSDTPRGYNALSAERQGDNFKLDVSCLALLRLAMYIHRSSCLSCGGLMDLRQ